MKILKKSGSEKGFTLIELMVVIAIIGILSAIMMASFSAAKSRSRDVKRISDLSNIQLALAGYFDRCGAYPASLTIGTGESSCTSSGSTIKLSTFISSIPTDPLNSGAYAYLYLVDSAHGYDDYFLHATLENNNTPANNSLSSTPSAWYSGTTTCSQTAKDYCIGPK